MRPAENCCFRQLRHRQLARAGACTWTVFEGGADAVALGLVDSLRRPGGNVTGVTQLSTEAAPKLLEFLHELLPAARVIALLVNQSDAALTEANNPAGIDLLGSVPAD